jgi:hypothetical protein
MRSVGGRALFMPEQVPVLSTLAPTYASTSGAQEAMLAQFEACLRCR